jgi:uncharacterized protein YbjT (DUF2867 family)
VMSSPLLESAEAVAAAGRPRLPASRAQDSSPVDRPDSGPELHLEEESPSPHHQTLDSEAIVEKSTNQQRSILHPTSPERAPRQEHAYQSDLPEEELQREEVLRQAAERQPEEIF